VSSSQTEQKLSKLEGLGQDLISADRDKKSAEACHKEARGKFMKTATLEAGKGALARTTVRVPLDYFERTGLTEEEWLATRHPLYVEITEEDERVDGAERVFLLEEDPQYRPVSVEVPFAQRAGDAVKRYSIGKTTSSGSPSLDLEALERDDPEVYAAITVEREIPAQTVVEPDADKLQALVAEQPEKVAVIQRNMIFPEPQAKLTPVREVKEA